MRPHRNLAHCTYQGINTHTIVSLIGEAGRCWHSDQDTLQQDTSIAPVKQRIQHSDGIKLDARTGTKALFRRRPQSINVSVEYFPQYRNSNKPNSNSTRKLWHCLYPDNPEDHAHCSCLYTSTINSENINSNENIIIFYNLFI